MVTKLINSPNFWQVTAILVAIGIAIITWFIMRRRKTLAYTLMEIPLLTVDEILNGKLRLVFEDTPIQNVYLVFLSILNNGEIPIASSDFERPLSFTFGGGSNILSAEVVEAIPKSLKPQIRIESSKIFILDPTLLNCHDTITVKLLIAEYGKIIETGARIIGIRDIKKITAKRVELKRILWASICGFISCSLIYIFLRQTFLYYFPMVFMGLFLILFYIKLFREYKD